MSRLNQLACLGRAHLADVRRNTRRDAGYTTETILVTALLTILALTVLGIIIAKVTGKANSIDLG